MKAIVQTKYGPPPDVLELRELDQPVVGDGDVLVQVHAASIHIGDSHMVRGVPSAMRPIFSMSRAKSGIPGTDIAGTVEAIGKNATRFRLGDEVFGWCKGAFAEYVATPEESLALKPVGSTLNQAAAIGTSAFTALQALRDQGNLRSGQKVLITGASGGVGTYAVQIAKSFGAEVTGVCSTRNVEMVRSLGADHVVDYTQQDFTQGEHAYDLILDNVGSHSLSETRKALESGGVLLANGAPVSGFVGGLGRFAWAFVTSLFNPNQRRPFVATSNGADLATLKEFAEAGTITPVIDRVFGLSDTAEAFSHVGAGHSQGKTIVTVVSGND
jgi:NADPH:quinone reductase-like Zn-dependent oxidoreductase